MPFSRRSFIKRAVGAAGTAVVAPALLAPGETVAPIREAPAVAAVLDHESEMQRILYEAAIADTRLLKALVEQRVISSGYAMERAGIRRKV